MKGKIPFNENVRYVLRDKNGCKKKIFKYNWLGKKLSTHGIEMRGWLFGTKDFEMNIANATVTTGRAAAAGKLGGESVIADFEWIAIGIGTDDVATTDTALGSESTTGGCERDTTAATVSLVTTSGGTTDDTLQLVTEFTITGTFAITESGVFNDDTTGVMLARQKFAAINVSSGDTLQITWKLQIT